MGRSRKKNTKTDTPLFYETMEQMNRDHPMTEAELQATVDQLKAEGRMPSREQWEAIKQQVEAALTRTLRKLRT
jgi:hypothetical protein